MFTVLKNSKKGFSLVEILIVIAIIGILSSVILASLTVARQKSRDAKRVAEMWQIKRGLDIYFDGAQSYPSTTPVCSPACPRPSDDDVRLQLLNQSDFLPSTPIPPPGGADQYYVYRGVYDVAGTPTECDIAAPAGTTCTRYELGVSLERSDNVVLQSDADKSVGAFYGANPSCTGASAGTELCYDIEM